MHFEAAEQIAKNAGKVIGKAGSKTAFAAIFGIGGIGLDLAYEVGSIGADMAMDSNVTLKGALQNNWITGAFMEGTGQEAFHKELFAKDSSAKPFGMAMDLITKIESEEQFEEARRVIKEMRLDGLVFIGGDDTNTNAYHLANYLQKSNCKCAVVGIPKTIDGDLKSDLIETSFGFDTACKVYSEMIGNICVDAMSSLKYWHFIKLMGRKASHVTLECALQTHPNLVFIGEEVEERGISLKEIVNQISDIVIKRAEKGMQYGVCLIPEGLIEFIPEVKKLIAELNRLLAEGKGVEALTKESNACFQLFPKEFQNQLLEDRDPHGNVQVSKIETEKLLSHMVKEDLKRRSSSAKFTPTHHFFGYEGRCAKPSRFDATYCYQLGEVSALLIRDGKTGVMAALRNLAKDPELWEPIGINLGSMMCEEERKGEKRMVIEKALVKLSGPIMHEFQKNRKKWALEDHYKSPGPIQFYGPEKDDVTFSLKLG